MIYNSIMYKLKFHMTQPLSNRDLVQSGKHKESNSPYATQVTLVMKKNGKVRVIIDFRV